MNTANNPPSESQVISAKGKGEKYIAIFLISISVVALLATPSTQTWLVLLEGLAGISGVLLFVHSRLRFWREVKKQIK